jgi:hypothetical protein
MMDFSASQKRLLKLENQLEIKENNAHLLFMYSRHHPATCVRLVHAERVLVCSLRIKLFPGVTQNHALINWLLSSFIYKDNKQFHFLISLFPCETKLCPH